MIFSRKHLFLAVISSGLVSLFGLNIQSGFDPVYTDPQLLEVRVMPQPACSSRSIIMVEEHSGAILYQKDADAPIPPASLTKLVVMALTLDYLQKSGIRVDAPVTISARAWAVNAPERSSLMFLGPGQHASWQDLLLGLAVDSGNDAAVALAENIDGSVDVFVEHMNQFCRRIGLEKTHFVEPSGYDEHSLTTARDFAHFVWYYLRTFPQALDLYHSVRQFTWPREAGQKEIIQYNKNRLLRSYPGADGLKTGYIDESGYNLAFTAMRDNMRLIGVILGGTGDLKRFDDAASLLDYGFDQYRLVLLPLAKPTPIRVWQGSQSQLELPAETATVVLPLSLVGKLKPVLRQLAEVMAPIAAGHALAWAEFQTESGQTILRFPRSTDKRIEPGDFIVQGADSAFLWVRSLWGTPLPPKGTD